MNSYAILKKILPTWKDVDFYELGGDNKTPYEFSEMYDSRQLKARFGCCRFKYHFQPVTDWNIISKLKGRIEAVKNFCIAHPRACRKDFIESPGRNTSYYDMISCDGVGYFYLDPETHTDFLIHEGTFNAIKYQRAVDRWFLLGCCLIWVAFILGGQDLSFNLQQFDLLYISVVSAIALSTAILKICGLVIVDICYLFWRLLKELVIAFRSKAGEFWNRFEMWLRGL